MKRIFLSLIILLFTNTVFAESFAVNNMTAQNTLVNQNISYSDCTKMYNINNEKLFYLTIGAINANKYTIDEIQTANGYIIFNVNKSKYIATIASIDKNNSIIKITPCNNIYYFPLSIISNIYKYIDINKDMEL